MNEKLKSQLTALNWNELTDCLTQKGYALVSNLITPDFCNNMINDYNDPVIYRKEIVMEHHRFGKGTYKYFNYPLPTLIQTIRETVYAKLVPIANHWMEALSMERRFPDTLQDLQLLCKANNQFKPTVLLLKYEKGGYNTLHQDLYGAIFFPLQLVLFLNEPDSDYTGGEFVLVQQNPRAQSTATVLRPKKGDMLIFTTNFRPVKGIRGYYRAAMKHGVSELLSGSRHTLGIIFHDAA